MIIGKRRLRPIRAAVWSMREWKVLILSLLLAFVTAIFGVAINFSQMLATFFKPHSHLPAVQLVVNFLVLWLASLLFISYRRWRKEALKNQELSDIIDSISPDVLLVVDPGRTILMTSKSILRMFGYPPESLIGRKTDFLYGDRRSRSDVKHEIYDALENDGFHVGWANGARSNGSTFPLEIITGILKDHSGSVLLLRDISERKDTEKMLMDREVQLRQSQKMEALGQLAGGIAHDFNNLLTSILGFGKEAAQSLSQEHPAKQNLDEVLNSAERASKLTAQLLALGRKPSLQVSHTNINDVVKGMVLILKRTLGESISLDIHLDPEIGMVAADLGGVEQIILNLAVNARDAMPHGGTLSINTQRVIIDKATKRSTAPLGCYGLLTVRDSGVGMTDNVKEHIFEPFFTTKERGRGTGLGLSMVYGIIRQCCGHIAVESQPGEGTEFKLYFRIDNVTNAG